MMKKKGGVGFKAVSLNDSFEEEEDVEEEAGRREGRRPGDQEVARLGEEEGEALAEEEKLCDFVTLWLSALS